MIENVADSNDPPSADEQVTVLGSSGIADRVRSRKGTSAKSVKPTPKRRLVLHTPPTMATRQKVSKGKVVTSSAVEILYEDNEDIHGEWKSLLYCCCDTVFILILFLSCRSF